MKIGILTHHYVNNYGAFLQAFALQKAVAHMYPEAEVQIINYRNKKHYFINTMGCFRFYPQIESFKIWCRKIKQPRIFCRELRKNLLLTEPVIKSEDIEKMNFDCVIVGSDEVWNYEDSKSVEAIKFGIGLNHTRLISYAPSVGKVDHFEQIPDFVRTGIQTFSAISVRDSNTARLVKKISGKEPAMVLDPTFLIEWPAYGSERIRRMTQQSYILFYHCDKMPKEKRRKIIKEAKRKGMHVLGAGEGCKDYDYLSVDITPFEWVELFRKAEYVFTGTFHGTVFAILNKKNFQNYITIEGRRRKISMLLELLGIENRERLGIDIDYESVYRKIEKLKVQSLDYLYYAIKGE